MPLWLIICAIYVSWNLAGYLEAGLFKTSRLADCAYWLHERVFVLVFFLFLVRYLKNTLYKKYVWLAKTFLVIASLKLIYVIIVLIGWFRINEHWQIMGFIFIIILGYILSKWELKRR